MTVNVLKYGAVADGKTLCTESFNKAVSECAKTGGYVDVPAGRYVTGTIILQSNVVLRFEPGAVLLASKYQEDFKGTERGCSWETASVSICEGRYKKGINETHKPNPCQSVILAENAENCGVEGPGIVDGRRGGNYIGSENWENAGPAFLCVFSNCKNVFLRDVTFQNPGSFNVYTLNCTGVNYSGVKIFSRKCACGDGLDFDGSKNVMINNCFIDAGDDAIGLKTLTPSEPCENFTVTNCVLSSVWAAVRIGPETGSDFRNINISNCVFTKCNDGFKLQLCEDRIFEDFVFSNISMVNVMRPIFMTLNTYAFSMHSNSVRPPLGKFRRVKFDNFSCRQIEKKEENSEGQLSGNLIYAMQGGFIEDVTLSNITFYADGGVDSEDAKCCVRDELLADYIDKYPEALKNMGNYPSSILYARNVKGLTVDKCRMVCENRDVRPAIVADNVLNLRVIDCDCENTHGILKTVACEDYTVRDTNGEIYEASPEEFAMREKFAEKTAELFNEYAKTAKLTDEAIECSRVGLFAWNGSETEIKCKGGRTFAVIPKTKWDMKILVNGREGGKTEVASRQDTVTCFTFEITDLVKCGSNKIDFVLNDKKSFGNGSLEFVIYEK